MFCMAFSRPRVYLERVIRHRQQLLLWAAILAAGGTAAAVSPQWAYADYPCRIQFACPFGTNGYALLPFYHKDIGFEPDAFRIAGPPPNNAPLTWRLLGKTADRTLVLVQLDQPTTRTAQLLAYAAPAGVPRQGQEPGLRPTFPLAMTVQFNNPRFKGKPDTVERLLYMMQNSPRGGTLLPLTALPPTLPRLDRSCLLQLHTFILCPAEGAYGFRASGGDPLAGSVNGLPLTNGVAVITGPDCVPVRLLTASDNGQSSLMLEWMPPGATTFQAIPPEAFAGPALAVPRRVERLDRTLQPQFEADLDPPYAFHGLRGVFYPLTLLDRSENWLPYGLNQTWVFGDGSVLTNASPTRAFTNAGPHTITLSLGDELGFTTSVTHMVTWEEAIPRLYQLGAVPFPMAAAWYRSDILEPALLTEGSWPAGLEVRLTSRLTRMDGTVQLRTELIPPTHSPRITRMAACPAGEFDRLEWSIDHLGVVLTNGLLAALQPPFPSRPGRLQTDRLVDDAGRQIVYVIPRRPSVFPAPAAETNAPLLLIDDFITARTASDPSGTPDGFVALLADTLGQPLRLLPLSDWRQPGDAWKPLLKLADVPALAQTSTPCRILLALGGQDCALGVNPDSFERQAAALSDLLLQAGHRIIWVTPPPFPERPDKARLYAVALRRVAESRHLPVVDLFSLFAGSDSASAALFDPLFPNGLSAQGRRLAMDGIAEQLRRPPPSGESALEP